MDGPPAVLEGEVAPFGLAIAVGRRQDQPSERSEVDPVEALTEEALARELPEVEQAVVCLDDPSLVVHNHDLFASESKETRERHPLRDRVDLRHPDLPDLNLAREEQDLEVLGCRVPVDPEPLRDLGDDQSLRGALRSVRIFRAMARSSSRPMRYTASRTYIVSELSIDSLRNSNRKVLFMRSPNICYPLHRGLPCRSPFDLDPSR
ncbi:MAG: hypothetical protein ABFC38_14850 [Methanospirillum sp.]